MHQNILFYQKYLDNCDLHESEVWQMEKTTVIIFRGRPCMNVKVTFKQPFSYEKKFHE